MKKYLPEFYSRTNPDMDENNNASFSPLEIDALKPYCKRIQLKKDAVLMHAGDFPDACYYIENGIVAAVDILKSGAELYFNFSRFSTKQVMLFDANLIMKHPVPVTFVALTDVSLIKIDYNALYKIAQRDTSVFQFLIQSVSSKFIASVEQIRASHLESMEWQYCNILIHMATELGIEKPNGIFIEKNITQNQLSNYLGISRTLLSQFSNTLKEKGLIITGRKKLIIPSLKNLIEYQESITKETMPLMQSIK